MSMIAIIIAATACEGAINFAETCVSKGKELVNNKKIKHRMQVRRFKKRSFI